MQTPFFSRFKYNNRHLTKSQIKFEFVNEIKFDFNKNRIQIEIKKTVVFPFSKLKYLNIYSNKSSFIDRTQPF